MLPHMSSSNDEGRVFGFGNQRVMTGVSGFIHPATLANEHRCRNELPVTRTTPGRPEEFVQVRLEFLAALCGTRI